VAVEVSDGGIGKGAEEARVRGAELVATGGGNADAAALRKPVRVFVEMRGGYGANAVNLSVRAARRPQILLRFMT